jgi:hypothetical protein
MGACTSCTTCISQPLVSSPRNYRTNINPFVTTTEECTDDEADVDDNIPKLPQYNGGENTMSTSPFNKDNYSSIHHQRSTSNTSADSDEPVKQQTRTLRRNNRLSANRVHTMIDNQQEDKYEASFSRSEFIENLEGSQRDAFQMLPPRRSQRNIFHPEQPSPDSNNNNTTITTITTTSTTISSINTEYKPPDDNENNPAEANSDSDSSATVLTDDEDDGIDEKAYENEIMSKLQIINPTDTYLHMLDPIDFFIKLDEYKLGDQNESYLESYGWFDQRSDRKLYKKYVRIKGTRYDYLLVLFKKQTKYYEDKLRSYDNIPTKTPNPLNQLFRKDKTR